MLSGGIAVQILTSASSLVVALVLIRYISNAEYGYYILITTAVFLATTIQFSFIQPPMVIRLTGADRAARADLIGGLYRDQSRLVRLLAVAAAIVFVVLCLSRRLDTRLAVIVLASAAAVMAALYREFFRMVLFAYRLPNAVLKADSVYCLLLIGGVALATQSNYPAAVAALGMALAAVAGRLLLSRALWRHEPWNRRAPHGMLREIFHQGSFSAFGGGVHYLFSQGYTYLVAATLNVASIAALAATRLPVSPVGLLANGISAVMLPTVSRWSHQHVGSAVLRRLALFACGLAAAMCCYLLVMWWARDWIFVHVLKKNFEQRDVLLLTWAVIAVNTAFRDQFEYFLVARGRFRITSSVTFVSAAVSLSTSYFALRHFGVIGAPLGILLGELVNVTGLILFSLREARLRPRAEPLAA